MSTNVILLFMFLFASVGCVYAGEAGPDDATQEGDTQAYEKPDVMVGEYGLIGNSIGVYEICGPGSLSLPCGGIDSFLSLLILTDMEPNGEPKLPYRFVLCKSNPCNDGATGNCVVVEKMIGRPDVDGAENGLVGRLLSSDAYLSDDAMVMNALCLAKRPMRMLPYVTEAPQTGNGHTEKCLKVCMGDETEFVVRTASRPRVLKTAIEGVGMVDGIRWKNAIGSYRLCAHGAKALTSEQGEKKLCFYGKYYVFDKANDCLDFRIHCCIFDGSAQDIRRTRAEFSCIIGGKLDGKSGDITGLMIQPDCGADVVVEKRTLPFVSVENGLMLETVVSDGSCWRKGRPDGQLWFGGVPTKGVFTWSVPVLVYHNAKVALDHNYPDSLEGKYMIKEFSRTDPNAQTENER